MIKVIASKIKKLIQTGFFHIFGSNVINKIVSFCSSIILVRVLSKAEYGTFTYAWNIYSIILIFNGLGLVNGIIQLCSENYSNNDYSREIVKYGLRIGVWFDFILMVVVFCLARFIPLKIEGANELLLLLCFLPTIQFVYDAILAYIRSIRDNQNYSKLSVTNTVLYALLSVVGALCFKAVGLIIAHYLANIITVIVGIGIIGITKWESNTSVLPKDKKSAVKLSVVSMMNNGISQLLYLLDVFVLGIVAADQAVLASYKVATTIPSALVFIPSSLVIYIYPYFAEHKDDGNWCLKIYKKVVLGIGAFNLFISLLLFFLSKYIIIWIFGKQYIDAIPVFRILALNYFFSGTFRIISGNLLVTQRCLIFNLFVAIMSGIINVICDFYFISWWGSIGAALATLVVVLFSSVLSTFYLLRRFYCKKRRVV